MGHKIDNQLLQRFLDDEVSAGERAEVEAGLAEDEELRTRLAAGREIGDLLRVYSAKAVDEAKLDGLLAGIQGAIARDAAGVSELSVRRKARENGAGNGAGAMSHAAMSERASAVPKARSGRWIATVMLGGLAAAAAAGLLIMRVVGKRPDPTSAPIASAADAAMPAPGAVAADAIVSNHASIESLDVTGSSTIFTIPDDSGDDSTTVIWLSPDDGSDETGG